MELEDKIARAEVIDVSKLSGSVVKFGATVTLADEETDEEQTFQIVGEDEADIKGGRLSVTSPLARALIGKGKGDSVEVVDPARRQILRGRHRRLRLIGRRASRPLFRCRSLLQRHTRRGFRDAQHQRRFDVVDIGRRGQLGAEETLIAVPIGGDDLQAGNRFRRRACAPRAPRARSRPVARTPADRPRPGWRARPGRRPSPQSRAPRAPDSA